MKKDKTALMDMEEQIKKMDELLEKEKLKGNLDKKAYLEKLYGREFEDNLSEFKKADKSSLPKAPEFLKDAEDVPKTIHGPETEASKYITRQQNKAKLFRKLDSIMSSPVTKGLGKAAKIGGGLLGLASEALATEDLGDGEISKGELARLKAEKEMSPRDKYIKQMMQEKGEEPLSIKEQLNIDKKKRVIQPFQVESLIGKEKETVGQLRKGKEDKRINRSNRFSKLQRHLMQEK